MRAREQSPAEQLLAAQAGDGADRFVDPQEAAFCVDLDDADRGMFVGGVPALLLLAQILLAAVERLEHPLALGDVLEAADRADQLAVGVEQRIDVDQHGDPRAVRPLDHHLLVADGATGLQHLGKLGLRAARSPPASKNFDDAVNCSWVSPGCGGRPQISTARRLYWTIRPRVSQMQMATGSSSRMSSEARSACSSDSGTWPTLVALQIGHRALLHAGHPDRRRRVRVSIDAAARPTSGGATRHRRLHHHAVLRLIFVQDSTPGPRVEMPYNSRAQRGSIPPPDSQGRRSFDEPRTTRLARPLRRHRPFAFYWLARIVRHRRLADADGGDRLADVSDSPTIRSTSGWSACSSSCRRSCSCWWPATSPIATTGARSCAPARWWPASPARRSRPGPPAAG